MEQRLNKMDDSATVKTGPGNVSLSIGGFIKAVAIADSDAEAMGAYFIPATLAPDGLIRRGPCGGLGSPQRSRTRSCRRRVIVSSVIMTTIMITVTKEMRSVTIRKDGV